MRLTLDVAPPGSSSSWWEGWKGVVVSVTTPSPVFVNVTAAMGHWAPAVQLQARSRSPESLCPGYQCLNPLERLSSAPCSWEGQNDKNLTDGGN